MNELENLLSKQQFADISLVSVLISLAICMLLVSIISWYYKKYSQVIGGKTYIGSVLPIIGLTVFLVITVVKSSLALSLGLVGALSIVRFRTPIKEPEELGFLFLAIAVGLGFGAGFQLVTTVVVLAILIFLRIFSGKISANAERGEYTLILRTSIDKYKETIAIINTEIQSFKVTRIEAVDDCFEINISASLSDKFDISRLITNLNSLDSKSEIQMIESGVNW